MSCRSYGELSADEESGKELLSAVLLSTRWGSDGDSFPLLSSSESLSALSVDDDESGSGSIPSSFPFLDERASYKVSDRKLIRADRSPRSFLRIRIASLSD